MISDTSRDQVSDMAYSVDSEKIVMFELCYNIQDDLYRSFLFSLWRAYITYTKYK